MKSKFNWFTFIASLIMSVILTFLILQDFEIWERLKISIALIVTSFIATLLLPKLDS